MPGQRILIVDDQPHNIAILHAFLEERRYDLIVAHNGDSALAIVQKSPPDLILLDVMLPDINGFEICRRLKAQPEYADLPVIFMTARVETESKLEGFAVGGVDYITKPFYQEEVQARIQTHLTVARQRRELLAKNRDLERHNAELDAFAHTVAHDLKNPLNAILAHLDLAQFAHEDGNTQELEQALRNVRKVTHKAADIIEALLLLAGTSRHTQMYLDSFDMRYVVDRARERLAVTLKQAEAELQAPDTWPFVIGYPAWVEEIWVNYITNAIKYGGSPPRIELGLDESAHEVRFWVRDNGPGLNEEEQAKLFIPFTRLHSERGEGHGLGLCIVQQIAEKLGGRVGVESMPGQGSTFYFVLPRPASDADR